jgi:hypothetical protein
MNSLTLNYHTSGFQGLLNHGWQPQMFVRDEREERRSQLEAQVRSGDYFITLATNLEQISKRLQDNPERASLQTIITDLLYLQTKYIINQYSGRR